MARWSTERWWAILFLGSVVAGCATGGGSETGASGGGAGPSRRLLPGVILTTETSYYDVEGSTAEQMLTSIRAKGPEIDGVRFGARTTWNARWRYRLGTAGGDCRLVGVDVQLSIETTMPRWIPAADASDSLRRSWTDFVAALDGHEEVHREHALEAAREVRDALRRFVAPGCVAADRDANEVARDVIDRYRERDRLYDLETDHGRNQGAVLPGTPSVEES